MPLYKVTDAENGDIRLVNSHSRSAAKSYITEDRFTVTIPDPLEAARLAAEGVAIETTAPPTKRGFGVAED